MSLFGKRKINLKSFQFLSKPKQTWINKKETTGHETIYYVLLVIIRNSKMHC